MNKIIELSQIEVDIVSGGFSYKEFMGSIRKYLDVELDVKLTRGHLILFEVAFAWTGLIIEVYAPQRIQNIHFAAISLALLKMVI